MTASTSSGPEYAELRRAPADRGAAGVSGDGPAAVPEPVTRSRRGSWQATQGGSAAGVSAVARGRAGLAWTLIAVVAAGLAVTAVLAVVTFRGHQRAEGRLLALQTRLIAAAGQAADQLYVEDHLGGAATLAAATDGNVVEFGKAMASAVTAKGPFVSGSLWQLSGGPPRRVALAGRKPLLAPGAVRLTALLSQAAASTTFVVTKVTGPGAVRLAFAAAAAGPHGRFAVYAEQPLPASRRTADQPGSPLGPLYYAVYLGRSQRPGALLETDWPGPLPLPGTTFTTGFVLGNTFVTITTSPRTSLTGTVSQDLPWAIVTGGVLLTLLAAVAAARLVRGRAAAERLSREVSELYLEQRSHAETLQHALLPQRLPEIPGMVIAARYLPGTVGVDIGGDWYDVVPLDGGRFVFKIGDVSGRGVDAAAVMASLHFAGRAYALEGHQPHTILDQLARILDVVEDHHFATVLCGLVDVPAHTVLLASAGHLPPVLASGGQATIVELEPAPPIGVAYHCPYEQIMVTIPPRGTLIACTDGLVERRGESVDAGLERLQQAASHDGAPLGEFLDRIITELTADSPADDIALLGLKWLS